MADIFLSYKREDRDEVRPLAEALEGKGWSVWWDTRIGVGETWDRVIETELAAAKCVVVVWSKLSVDSRWVRSEAHEGLDRECLVPVIIDSAKPPLAFKLVQSTDLTHWRGDASAAPFADVAMGVQRIVGQGSGRGARAVDPRLERARRADKERGDQHYQSHDYDQAIAAYTKAIEIDPKFVEAYIERGRMHREKEDYDRSTADFTAAVEIDPKSYVAFGERANNYHRMKIYDRAIADWSRVNDLDPKFELAYEMRGFAYEVRAHVGDGDRAVADYRKALEINPASRAKGDLRRLGVAIRRDS